MKICKKSQSIERNNADTCTVWEYPMDEAALNFALSEVHGRYPESGVAVNTQVKELVYVMQGSGELWINDKTTAFAQGDALLIEPGERYYFQGDFTLAIACNPAFTPEQHTLRPA